MNYIKTGNSYIVRIDKGEEIVTQLTRLVVAEGISVARVSGIGATDNATVGAYNTSTNTYHSHHYDNMMEILSIMGNITTKDNEPYLHLHMTLGLEDGSCVGGHVNSAVVSATCELFVDCYPCHVDRYYDNDSGLNLMKV